MLVLSRLAQQGIQINDDIRIVVLDIRNGKVRLGIEAPKTVSVHRDEVYAQIKEQRKAA